MCSPAEGRGGSSRKSKGRRRRSATVVGGSALWRAARARRCSVAAGLGRPRPRAPRLLKAPSLGRPCAARTPRQGLAAAAATVEASASGRWACPGPQLGWSGLGRAFGLGPIQKDEICFFRIYF
jgi:hypothetical protein